MNVLMVDDEIAVIQILRKAFHWEEIGTEQLFEAHNAAQARQIVAQENVQIIICDIEMPQESGIHFLTWVQETHPEIVCVILTGYPDFSYAQEAVNIGIYKFLLKPVSYEELGIVMKEAAAKVESDQKHKKQLKYGEYFAAYPLRSAKLFFQDLIMEEILPTSDIQRELIRRGLPMEGLFGGGLVFFRREDCLTMEDDENIKCFALINVSEELYPNVIGIHINHEVVWVIRSKVNREELQRMCFLFLKKVETYIKCKMQAYISYNLEYSQIAEKYRRLRQMSLQYQNRKEMIFFEEDLNEKKFRETNDRMKPDYDAVECVKRYLEEHCCEQVSRKMIEEQVHLNQDYLNRIYKNVTGYTLMEYIQYCRIKKAKWLLRETGMTVGEIAGETGYDSPPYFSKIFKKWTGITPLDYRNQS